MLVRAKVFVCYLERVWMLYVKIQCLLHTVCVGIFTVVYQKASKNESSFDDVTVSCSVSRIPAGKCFKVGSLSH